jgi:transposase-like protein
MNALDLDFPKTALEFERRFGDEAACWEYLRAKKWPDGFRCPRCRGGSAYFVAERGRDECAACGHQTSATAGTLFHGTRTPLRTWFRAIFEFVSAKHGCSAKHLARTLGLAYETAWTWLHKIRDVFFRPDRAPLSGDVEVDETYVGGPEPGCPGRARGEKKILVVGAVETDGRGGCKRARLAPAPNAEAETLQAFIVDVVAPGAKVRTDGLPSYRGLEHAYEHEVDVIGKDPREAVKRFPCVHRVFSLFKRTLLGVYHGSWSPKWAALYCEEFTFRFNRRDARTRAHLVRRVVEHAFRRAPRIHALTGKTRKNAVLPA